MTLKNANKLFIVVGCIALLIISWIIVLGAKSDSAKQANLMAQAAVYTDDEVYVLAIPLLEEAAGYDAKHTLEAETALKEAYLIMTNQRGYRRKYIDLLNKQMNRKDATVDIFLEAANFYLNDNKLTEAYTVLKDGIAKTGNDELITLYEDNRYVYRKGYDYYEDVTTIYGATIGVMREGLWGLASSDGELYIPCEYDKISTFNGDRTIVEKDGAIFAVDENNNRLALLKEKVSDFSNYSDGRVGLLTSEGWFRASGDFQMGSTVFEEIGAYSNGYVAAKQNGKWGVVDKSDVWLISAEHDGIVMDELGRCYAQGAAFVKKGNAVYLYSGGKQIGDSYEDAKPFSDEGYAAVKKNGKWGFVDNLGELKIDYQFEDALSFGQHLAAKLFAFKNIGSITIFPYKFM